MGISRQLAYILKVVNINYNQRNLDSQPNTNFALNCIMGLQATAIVFWNIIDGRNRGSQHTHHGIDPRTDAPLWPCPVASLEDLEDAVKAARTSFVSWATTGIQDRQQALLTLAEKLLAEKELISGIICKETGKSVRMSMTVKVNHSRKT